MFVASFRNIEPVLDFDKCQFLEEHVKFVGHDLTSNGCCPARSKFDLVNDWKIPILGQSLHYCVGLAVCYLRYTPYLEIRIILFDG